MRESIAVKSHARPYEGFPVNMLLLVQTPRNHVPGGSGYGKEIGYGDGRLIRSCVIGTDWG